MSDKFYNGHGLTGKNIEDVIAEVSRLDNLMHTIVLSEDQRQMILLALAELSIARPGFLLPLSEIASKMDNRGDWGDPQMFEEFRRLHSDPVAQKLAES